MRTFQKAGLRPLCGVYEGFLGECGVCVSTQNRNFEGPMGNPRGFIYPALQATPAATAVGGRISDPREFL